MANKDDSAVEAAVEYLNIETNSSIRAAAALYSISEATLRRRLKGGQSRQNARTPQQLLSPEQEDRLVQWILDLEKQGHPPTHAQLREMAQHISIFSGGPSHFGHKWVSRFLQRQTAIQTKIGCKMDALRIKNSNPEDLQAWYALVKRNIDAHGILSADIWNMDETGLAVGSSLNGRVIGSTATKRTYKKEPAESREWVSIIEAISAGHSIQPLVIFKGKSLQST